MPSVSGQAIDELKISTDAQVGNLVELKTDIVGTFTHNKGNNLEDRTRGGDEYHRYDPVKKNPFCRVEFDVNTDVAASWGVIGLDSDGERAFTYKIGAVRETGVMIIEGPEETYNSENGVYQTVITFRPRGKAWVTTRE